MIVVAFENFYLLKNSKEWALLQLFLWFGIASLCVATWSLFFLPLCFLLEYHCHWSLLINLHSPLSQMIGNPGTLWFTGLQSHKQFSNWTTSITLYFTGHIFYFFIALITTFHVLRLCIWCLFIPTQIGNLHWE